jgi:hypothetical protein
MPDGAQAPVGGGRRHLINFPRLQPFPPQPRAGRLEGTSKIGASELTRIMHEGWRA